MSLEASLAQSTSTPISSGRSSPVPARLRNRDEDDLNKRDKTYRRYASGVERVLAQSVVEEWADYIDFLRRLLKALQQKPSTSNDIPHKAAVAKRLSQCLNPVLPSGVHQKTLEVYAYVFAILGKNGLAENLGLYLPGFTPVLSFAALSVKPNVLAIFETYIVVLDPRALRPALKALILALLPGLEEATSDEFERTLRILDSLKDSSTADEKHSKNQPDSPNNQYFWQCLFLASITSANRRPGALAYLIRCFPHLGSRLDVGEGIQREPLEQNDGSESKDDRDIHKAIEAVASPDPGLLIRCFCAGLRDEQLLTQRGFLDLLVTNLPLHSSVLREIVVQNDLEKLVGAATGVVSRRDMSLNRRLWAWFLGPEAQSDNSNGVTAPQTPTGASEQTVDSQSSQSFYFEKYGLPPLIKCLRRMIESDTLNAIERMRPLRICLSLMDRWEIGELVVPRLFLLAMRSVWRYHSSEASKEARAEVLRSANMFFDGVESSLIWGEIYRTVEGALNTKASNAADTRDSLELVYFMVTNFNIREEEMQIIHMPLVSLLILVRGQKLAASLMGESGKESSDLLSLALRIANRLLDLIPQRVFTSVRDPKTIYNLADGNGSSIVGEGEQVLVKIDLFYSQGGVGETDPPLSSQLLGQFILQASINLAAHLMRITLPMASAATDTAMSVLQASIRKIPGAQPELETFFAGLMLETTASGDQTETQLPFSLLAAKVSALECIYSTAHSRIWISDRFIWQVVPSLVAKLWLRLSPARPRYNVDAVRCIWRLEALCSENQIVEGTIVTLMVSNSATSGDSLFDVESFKRFITLWSHSGPTSNSAQSRRTSMVPSKYSAEKDLRISSELPLLERPLMLILDVLEDPSGPLFAFAVHWLQSLSSLLPIINVLVSRIAKQSIVSRISSHLAVSQAYPVPSDEVEEDLLLCLHYLKHVQHVVQYATTNLWPALASPSKANEEEEFATSNQDFLTATCLKLLQQRYKGENSEENRKSLSLSQTALSLLQAFISGPSSRQIVEMALEEPLLEELINAVDRTEHFLQVSLMEVLLTALNARTLKTEEIRSPRLLRVQSKDVVGSTTNLNVPLDGIERKGQLSIRTPTPPPAKLLQCLTLGVTSPNSRPVLENWIAFLGQCLPLYGDGIFQVLIPLIECFCSTLSSAFNSIQAIFGTLDVEGTGVLEPTLVLLLNGLEQSLATAHERLVADDMKSAPLKSPEQQPQGFFGNMVSGVFASETNMSKTLTANNRLTVLLCFKDAIRVSYSIWAWGNLSNIKTPQESSTSASFTYTTQRLRSRTRRIFEHLFAAEPLECLETVIELWQTYVRDEDATRAASIFNLLNAIESSRPKNTIPAIFNAMYSRTNPAALEPMRKSTLTSNITDTSLAAFLVIYTRSLEDDAMDEMWTDCMTFLKDVLANPMPHRQTLAKLLEFTAVLGEKVDNTKFGEQRKLRRDLGDLFVRLLTATLTIKPIGQESFPSMITEKQTLDPAAARPSFETRGPLAPEGLVSVLATITPNLGKVLVDSERIASLTSILSTQILGPTIRSKSFPENINQRTIDLMVALANIPEASKFWKKDISDAFNDPKFFANPVELAERGWLQILRQWTLGEKDRMPEYLARLTTPTAAGILFGVGATSARLEADRKAQLNLRRIALLILAAANDTFVVNLGALQEKIIDLLTATTASSPSSTTRAEIYMVIRALVLKTSLVHLSSFWPTISSELYDAISSAYPTAKGEAPSPWCLLQACKLLDTLLTLGLDEFQMQEWLFVTDTTDAVYRPSSLKSVALADELAEALSTDRNAEAAGTVTSSSSVEGKRKPMLMASTLRGISKDNLMEEALRPFFKQLSIHVFESTYSMEDPDWKVCFDELVLDLFDDSTLV